MKAAEIFDLTGQVALVTGASSGLGVRFAEVLAANGAAAAASMNENVHASLSPHAVSTLRNRRSRSSRASGGGCAAVSRGNVAGRLA